MPGQTIVIATGGFDPLHSGHIAYLKECKRLGDKLYVGVNSDDWLVRKKGKFFLPLTERKAIIAALKPVDFAMSFNDDDGTAIDMIRLVLDAHGLWNSIDAVNIRVIFANGGDRTRDNIPEMIPKLTMKPWFEFAFGIGGDNKKNSSSAILARWDRMKVPV